MAPVFKQLAVYRKLEVVCNLKRRLKSMIDCSLDDFNESLHTTTVYEFCQVYFSANNYIFHTVEEVTLDKKWLSDDMIAEISELQLYMNKGINPNYGHFIIRRNVEAHGFSLFYEWFPVESK
jgi:hypothetical protein